MIFQFEILLVLGALAFYLQDSCALLYADELMLERVGGGWRVHSGAAMLVAGRRPFVPNPLAPHRPLMRVSLQQLLGDGPAECNYLAHFLNALAPFKAASIALLLLFVPNAAAGPVLLRHRGGTAVLARGGLPCRGAHRRNAVPAPARVAAVRARLRRPRLRMRLLPSAGDQHRRKLTVRADVMTLARYPAIVDARSHPSLHTAAGERIEEMLRRWESETPHAQTLLQYRQKLLAGVRAR